MFQRESRVENYKCPDCGGKLVSERDLLLCKEHGAFFAYGPQLLVRVAQPSGKAADSLLPWETPRVSLA
jgi:hypothetical protein